MPIGLCPCMPIGLCPCMPAHRRLRACMHSCTHARMHACTHARMHACTRAHTYKEKRLDLVWCQLVCTLVHTRARTHTHTHTHTHMLRTGVGGKHTGSSRPEQKPPAQCPVFFFGCFRIFVVTTLVLFLCETIVYV